MSVHQCSLSYFQRQTKEIAQKTEIVLGDLAKVEPAVKEAQQGELDLIVGNCCCLCCDNQVCKSVYCVEQIS